MENQKRIIKKLDKYKKDKKARFRDILNNVILHYSNKHDFNGFNKKIFQEIKVQILLICQR